MNRNYLRFYLHSITVNQNILEELFLILRKNDRRVFPADSSEERKKAEDPDREAVNVQFKLVWESSELTLTDPDWLVPQVSFMDLKKINIDFHSRDKSIIIRINFENTRLSWFFLSSTDPRWLAKTTVDLSNIFYAYRTENELLHSWNRGLPIYISLSLLSAFLISIPLDLISWGELSFVKYICVLVISVPSLYGWEKFLRWLYPWFETPIMWRTKYQSKMLLIIILPLMTIVVLYGTAIKTTDILFNVILKILAICSIAALYLWLRKARRGKSIRPRVINTSPIDGASNVPTDSLVQATFSEPMSDSFNRKTFVIKKDKDESLVTGRLTLSPDARTVSFDPEPDFSHNTTYSVTISKDVKGKGGIELTSKVHWTFTTLEKVSPSAIVTYDTISKEFQTSSRTISHIVAKNPDSLRLLKFKLTDKVKGIVRNAIDKNYNHMMITDESELKVLGLLFISDLLKIKSEADLLRVEDSLEKFLETNEVADNITKMRWTNRGVKNFVHVNMDDSVKNVVDKMKGLDNSLGIRAVVMDKSLPYAIVTYAMMIIGLQK